MVSGVMSNILNNISTVNLIMELIMLETNKKVQLVENNSAWEVCIFLKYNLI
jgi:hypothetical protein